MSGVKLLIGDSHVLFLLLFVFLLTHSQSIAKYEVVMENDILRVTLSNPDGIVTGIEYNGIDNLLEVLNDESNRGYWDLVWSPTGSSGTTGTNDLIRGTRFEVIVENEEQVEISFTRMWDPTLHHKMVPLNIDKRFVMLRESSGFYSYAIYEHLKEWPAFNLPQTRIVFKLRKDKFQYMVVGDNRHRHMPLPDDRVPPRGRLLNPVEAVVLVDPIEPEFKGEVDDKYQYSSENKDLRVNGWICSDPPVGCWQITPSNEFRTGGLLKQNLTSHVGPINLSMFQSAHYAGEDLVLKIKPDEEWKKVYGPVFTHVNCLSDTQTNPLHLWDNAKQQMMIELQNWPYTFPASHDFPKSNQRGQICGKLLVRDRYISDECICPDTAYVGLATPGDVGSWQRECKGYQFWTKIEENGNFFIGGVRAGDYNVYAWVPGFIGDYKNDGIVTITPCCEIDIGDLVFEPPRNGPTLWEIGVPDRSAAGFYIPEPSLKYINKLYVDHPDRFRQFGLWERYAELYPDKDLVYTVDESDYKTDWFFAQVNRKKEDGTYQGTTWSIRFKLDDAIQNETYTLRIALATANVAELQVRVNGDANSDREGNPPLFSTGQIGNDNTIARHGIHGLYRLYQVDVPGNILVNGENTIFLAQIMSSTPFQGVMYDYIRLEGPCLPNSNLVLM